MPGKFHKGCGGNQREIQFSEEWIRRSERRSGEKDGTWKVEQGKIKHDEEDLC